MMTKSKAVSEPVAACGVAKTNLQTPPVVEQEDVMAGYRATARRRWQDEARELEKRYAQARRVARVAADLLRERFGATRVLLFGSLAHGLWYSETSDIDLACEGLTSETYLLAVAHLQDISDEFMFDLAPLESCRPDLREAILMEGLQI